MNKFKEIELIDRIYPKLQKIAAVLWEDKRKLSINVNGGRFEFIPDEPPSPQRRPTPQEADKLLAYLGGDWDITTCSECREPIVVEVMTGEPQTCTRLKCVYSTLKGEL